MHIDIITIFPEMFNGPFSHSIIKHAVESGKISLKLHNLRDWTTDKHHSVDAPPYGGGPGMVMMVEPIYKAVESLKTSSSHVIITSAKGTRLVQDHAVKLSHYIHLILICGHYEGVDQRVYDHIADEAISIGDFVLTGGELPAMVLVDTITRLLPGVLGDPHSPLDESHTTPDYIEAPHYTRPQVFNGWQVPDTLLSGNHEAIKNWRLNQAKTGN